jgi:hypothetical protein
VTLEVKIRGRKVTTWWVSVSKMVLPLGVWQSLLRLVKGTLSKAYHLPDKSVINMI